MIATVVLALALTPAVTADGTGAADLAEAARAMEAGRTGQARDMVELAIARGEKGVTIDRLLAQLALSERRDAQALAAYRDLLSRSPNDAAALIGAATAAARLRQDAEATRFASAAVQASPADWRPFNLLGVLADRHRDWSTATRAYAEALRRAPDQPALLNNAGWSALSQGAWERAETLLRKAAALAPRDKLIANNLELARAALADRLPERRLSESDEDYAARLNDAGVIARVRGDERRAGMAFTQAVAVRGRWFERAYNNLSAGRSAQR